MSQQGHPVIVLLGLFLFSIFTNLITVLAQIQELIAILGIFGLAALIGTGCIVFLTRINYFSWQYGVIYFSILIIVMLLLALASQFVMSRDFSVSGTIQGQTCLPNIDVSLYHEATGATNLVTTDTSYAFKFNNVPDGEFDIIVDGTTRYSVTTPSGLSKFFVSLSGGNIAIGKIFVGDCIPPTPTSVPTNTPTDTPSPTLTPVLTDTPTDMLALTVTADAAQATHDDQSTADARATAEAVDTESAAATAIEGTRLAEAATTLIIHCFDTEACTKDGTSNGALGIAGVDYPSGHLIISGCSGVGDPCGWWTWLNRSHTYNDCNVLSFEAYTSNPTDEVTLKIEFKLGPTVFVDDSQIVLNDSTSWTPYKIEYDLRSNPIDTITFLIIRNPSRSAVNIDNIRLENCSF